jgi:hypothetical protein
MPRRGSGGVAGTAGRWRLGPRGTPRSAGPPAGDQPTQGWREAPCARPRHRRVTVPPLGPKAPPHV